MKLWDALPEIAQKITAATIILGAFGALIVWLPTPLHTDAEAAQNQTQQQSAEACATVYQYELWIARAKEQLHNPSIPEWRKAELEVLIEDWQNTVNRLRDRYDC